jgi:hypothetical protein
MATEMKETRKVWESLPLEMEAGKNKKMCEKKSEKTAAGSNIKSSVDNQQRQDGWEGVGKKGKNGGKKERKKKRNGQQQRPWRTAAAAVTAAGGGGSDGGFRWGFQMVSDGFSHGLVRWFCVQMVSSDGLVRWFQAAAAAAAAAAAGFQLQQGGSLFQEF